MEIKPGGTSGGEKSFIFGIGLILLALGVYLLLDSVRVSSAPFGLISGRFGRGMGDTTSMGIIFVPFFLGISVLFFDAERRWAWWLAGLGLLVIIIEILSRVRFVLDVKTTHLLMILTMIAAGAGLLARSYLVHSADSEKGKKS